MGMDTVGLSAPRQAAVATVDETLAIGMVSTSDLVRAMSASAQTGEAPAADDPEAGA